jgi:hypothetical protein
MKRVFLILCLGALLIVPGISLAKGVPLFFQTGDELFEIDGAPEFEGGYSVGYACQRFGLFGADFWTWDCEIMAVNTEDFSAGELSEEMKAEFSGKFSLSDRVRNPWNQYGGFVLGLFLVGGVMVKIRS